MTSTSGQNDIRGLQIDQLAKGYADEEFIFKNFLTVTPTSAREIRWYQKTAGILDSTATSGITASQIANTAFGALPVVVEQSWTRQTSHVRKYFVESPWITFEDIRDSDIDVLQTNVRDLTRAVANQVDTRIYSAISGSGLINSGSAMGFWSASTSNPVADLLSGSQLIRQYSYDIANLALLIAPKDYKNLLNWLITYKGSSIPQFSSDQVEKGVLLKLLGHKVVVSNNATAGMAMGIVPQRAATWKTFTPITAQVKEEIGVGSKIRVWEEGEVLLTDPAAVYLIKGV